MLQRSPARLARFRPLLLGAAVVLLASGVSPETPTARTQPVPSSGHRLLGLPSYFVENTGVTAADVRFFLRRPGWAVGVRPDGIVAVVAGTSRVEPRDLERAKAEPPPPEPPPGAFRMRFVEAAEGMSPIGEGTLAIEARYTGEGRTRRAPLHARLRWKQLWPGIDARLDTATGDLRYAFELAPQAKLSDVRLAIDGARSVAVDERGDLVVTLPHGTVRHTAPRFYEVRGRERDPVGGGFVVRKDGSVGFRVTRRDPTAALLIDPEIRFATYFGGVEVEDRPRVAVVGPGDVVVGLETASPELPDPALFTAPLESEMLAPPFSTQDLCVFRLDLGRPPGEGGPVRYLHCLSNVVVGPIWPRLSDVAALPDGRAWVVGNAHFGTFGGLVPGWLSEAPPLDVPFAPYVLAPGFAIALDAEGDLVAGTYLPPRLHVVTSVAVEGEGPEPGVHVAGFGALDYPGVTGCSVGTPSQLDPFVAKLAPDLSSPLRWTVIGGDGLNDGVKALALANGRVHVGGPMASSDFPVTAGPLPALDDAEDGFVAVLEPDGCPSTAPGSSPHLTVAHPDVEIRGIAAGDRVYAVGESSPAFGVPVVLGLAETGAPITEFRFRGAAPGRASAAELRPDGRLAFTGRIDSSGLLPVPRGALHDVPFGGYDAFFAILSDPADPDPDYFTYLGGSGWDDATDLALDGQGCAYLVGTTSSKDFQLAGAVQPAPAGSRDVFVLQLCDVPPQLEIAQERLDPAVASDHGWPCVDGEAASPGADVCFRVRVAHTGGDPVAGLEIHDRLEPVTAIEAVEARAGSGFVCTAAADGVRCAASAPVIDGDEVLVDVRVTLAHEPAVAQVCSRAQLAGLSASATPLDPAQSVCVAVGPGLQVTKSPMEAFTAQSLEWPCEARDTACFTTTVEPVSGGPGAGFRLVEVPDPELTLVDWASPDDGVDCDLTASPPSCTASSGPSYEPVTIHVRATAPIGAGLLCNGVEIEGLPPGGVVTNDPPEPACVDFVPPPRLTLTKRRDDAGLAEALGWDCDGLAGCFTVEARRTGGGPLPALALVEEPAPGLSLVEWSSPADDVLCDLGASPPRCEADEEPGRQRVQVHLRAVAAAPGLGVLCNEARLEGLPDDAVVEGEPTARACTIVGPPPADLFLSEGPMSAAAADEAGWRCSGREACFALRVRRTGGGPMRDFRLLDTPGDGTRLVDWRASHPGVECDLGPTPASCRVAVGEGLEEVTVRLRAVPTLPTVASLCNSAKLDALPPGAVATPQGGVTSCVAIPPLPPPPPVLELVKLPMGHATAEALGWTCGGDRVCFTVVVRSTGGGPMRTFRLLDQPAEGMALEDWASPVPGARCDLTTVPAVCNVPSVAPLRTATIYLRAKLDLARWETQQCSRAWVDGAEPPVAGEWCIPARRYGRVRLESTFLGLRARELGWACAGVPARPGEEVCFRAVLRHLAGGPSGPIRLADQLGPGLELVEARTTGMSCQPTPATGPASGEWLACDVPSLSSGGEARLELRARVAPQEGPLPSGLSPARFCNLARAESGRVEPAEREVCATVGEPIDPDVRVTIQGPDNLPIHPGGESFATIRVDHAGGPALEDALLEMRLVDPAGRVGIESLGGVGCTATGTASGPSAERACEIGELAPFGHVVATARYRADPSSAGQRFCPEVRLRYRAAPWGPERVVTVEEPRCFEVGKTCSDDGDCHPPWTCRSGPASGPPTCEVEVFGGCLREGDPVTPLPECRP